MNPRKRRIFIRYLPQEFNGSIEVTSIYVNVTLDISDDGRQRIELVSATGFCNGLLLSATNLGNIICVIQVRRGIVGIEFEGLPVLGLSPGKIPVVLHLIGSQDGMGMGQ